MTGLANPTTPAEMRAYIVERLVGDTGEPDELRDNARAMAEKVLPDIRSGLVELLSVPLAVEVSDVEPTRLAVARPVEGDNCAMTFVMPLGSQDAVLYKIDSQAIAIIVSALFGGDPELPVARIERALSPTEIEIAGMVFERIAKAFNAAEPRAFELSLPLPKCLSGPELAKQVIRDGPAVRIDLKIGPSEAPGSISMMMPQRLLMKKQRQNLPVPVGSAGADTGWSERFGEEVMRSSVVLEATMPLARLTLADVAGFYHGQIIEFQESAKSEAKLSARHKTLFVCEFGKLGQNYTVRVRHPFDARQDLIDGLVSG